MIVFAGRRFCVEKYEGTPPDLEPVWKAKMLVGSEAECELSCEKLRAEDVVKAAASGDILEVASGLELRSSPEAVVAASRVRDAIIVTFGASDDDVGHAKLQASRRMSAATTDTALHNLPIVCSHPCCQDLETL